MKNKTQNQRSVFGRKYSKGEFGELIFFAVYVCLSAYNWKWLFFQKKNTKTYESLEEVKEKGKRKIKEKTGTSYLVLSFFISSNNFLGTELSERF